MIYAFFTGIVPSVVSGEIRWIGGSASVRSLSGEENVLEFRDLLIPK
jgi:hypothetical protein